MRGYAYEFLVAQSIIDNSPISKGLTVSDEQGILLIIEECILGN